MVLRGILDRALGGRVVFRGFAQLGELARVSKADDSFQRDLLKDHKKEIQKFLRSTNEYLFFPEVILSHRVEENQKLEFKLGPLDELIMNNSTYKSIDERIKYEVEEQEFKSQSDDRVRDRVKLLTISIDEDLVKEKNEAGRALFNRIDGNHRLSASEKLEEQTISRLITPFSIILFEDIYVDAYDDEKGEQIPKLRNDRKTKRFERVVFHNINSKSIPLESEDILKGIIDDDNLFSDDNLKNDTSFGWSYFATRKFLVSLPADQLIRHYPKVAQTFSENGKTSKLKWRSSVKKIFEFLSEKPGKIIDRRDSSIRNVLNSIRYLENILEIKLGDLSPINSGLSIAIIYFLIKYDSEKELNVFLKWVKSNHIYELNDLDPYTIHNIYSKIKESRSRKVFVSMPFSDNDSQAKFKVIKKAIKEVNQGLDHNLELRPIRIDWFNPGYSYAVTDEILKLIDDSGYLIADLTGKNPNVYHEIGYLMGLNEKSNSSNNFLFVCRKDKDEDDVSKQLGFNLKHLQVKFFGETNELQDIVTESLQEFYKI